jgi:O-antigen/teichoic acid export membrane protein
MSTVRKVARNTGVILVWDVAVKLIGLFISIYLARYLGVGGFGNYSFIIAYTLSFGIIVDLGINTVLVREIVKHREKAEGLIANAIGIKLAIFVLVFLLSALLVNLLGCTSDVKIGTYIGMLAVLLSSNISILISSFQADLKMEYPAFADVVSKLFLGAMIFLISVQNGGIVRVMIATFASYALSLAILYAFARSRIKLRISFDTKVWRDIIKPAALLGLSGIFVSVIVRIDTILISIIRGNIEVGYYTIPSQLTDTTTLIPTAFIMSLFPLMSYYFKNSKEALARSFRLAMKYILMLAIPMAFGTTLLAGRIITAIYGASFAYSSTALVIMVWCHVLVSSVIVIESLLISLEKQKNVLIATGFSALFNVLLNLLLIPWLGFVGASIALLFTYVLLTMIYVYSLPRSLRKLDTVFIIRSALASLLMLLFIKYSPLSIFVLIPLAALIYFIALTLLGGISSEDVEILKRLYKS